MRVKIVKVFSDWFCIERVDHDGKEWSVRTPLGSILMLARRPIHSSDIEGTREEMLNLLAAIHNRTSYAAKRCAVHFTGSEFLIWSPRNSGAQRAHLSIEEAEELSLPQKKLAIEVLNESGKFTIAAASCEGVTSKNQILAFAERLRMIALEGVGRATLNLDTKERPSDGNLRH